MRRLGLAAVTVSTALLASSCGMMSDGLYNTPLPGGADVGDDPITLSADFTDVLDLVPQSSVRVNDIAVGRVSDIELNDDGRSARVELVVRDDVELPAGTTVRLKQTSLLGEKYVALVRPDEPAPGDPIESGDHIGQALTSRAAEVEEVLGALSLVLNGGGLGQFREISQELQAISTDRPGEIKGFLRQMRTFVTRLDDRKQAITDALDGLHALSTTLEGDRDRIISALEGLSPGMQVIVDQREQLVAMLESLDQLSEVTMETLDAAQEDIVADLERLAPILGKLADAGKDLPDALEILFTYPFPDSVLGAIEGDYLNVFVTTNFRTVPNDCDAIGCAWPQPAVDTYDPPGNGAAAQAAPRSLAEMYDGLVPGEEPGNEAGQGQTAPPPSLLPPTSSPTPGVGGPTVTVPSPPPSKAPSAPSSKAPDEQPPVPTKAPEREGEG